MTPTLTEACPDLQAWLPILADLITEPDTQPSIGRTQPGSAFPGNAAVFNVATDVHAMVRELEQDLRYAVSGTFIPRGGSDANTFRALDAICRLAEAVSAAEADQAAKLVSRHITIIMQLPAIDLGERARILPAPCPRCDRAKLLFYERSGRIACPGCQRRGFIFADVSDGCVQWEDGTIT